MSNFARLELFAREYVARGFDEVAALKAIDPNLKNYKTAAKFLLERPMVQDRIAQLRKELNTTVLMDAEAVLREWVTIAMADPAEISKIIKKCCRYCHGVKGLYQYKNERELLHAQAAWMAQHQGQEKAPEMPEGKGGFGFNEYRPPNPACMECGGEGTTDVMFMATDQLSPSARKLYDGAELTKFGMKVNVRSRDKALENIAKALGMLAPPPGPQAVGPGAPVAATVPALPNDPQEASRVYAEWIKQSG